MRVNRANEIYFVTNRCEQERFFLLPKPKINRLIGAWLAKALQEHGDGIQLYAFIFLSNHLHLLLRDTKGQLAELMWFFQSNLARAVNRELGRHGHFFSREYDAVPVLTDADFEERYAYVVTNAVKAGLVDRAAHGPFLSSLETALTDKPLRFSWLDRTRLHNRTRRGQRVRRRDFERTYELRLALPPQWRGLSTRARRARIRGLVRTSEQRYRRERRAEGRGVLGRRRILAQSPLMRPRNPARRPRIKVFCKLRELKEAYLAGLRELVGRYREAYGAWLAAIRRGIRSHVEWPPGCYPPSTLRPLALAA
jgi:REP element-mobilizing transposase RayT